ncbi:MAG: hypothetical protein RIC35_02380 [Marinoscillum sp.]
MKKYLFLLLIPILTACGGNENIPDPCAEFDSVDLEMLNLIKSIKQKYSADKLFVEKLEMSQVYWVQYRDRHIRAIYPKDWDRVYRKEYNDGVFNICKCQELSRMTHNRVDDLKLFTSGGPKDQQDCPSVWSE